VEHEENNSETNSNRCRPTYRDSTIEIVTVVGPNPSKHFCAIEERQKRNDGEDRTDRCRTDSTPFIATTAKRFDQHGDPNSDIRLLAVGSNDNSGTSKRKPTKRRPTRRSGNDDAEDCS
jgi:hypothetical protein